MPFGAASWEGILCAVGQHVHNVARSPLGARRSFRLAGICPALPLKIDDSRPDGVLPLAAARGGLGVLQLRHLPSGWRLKSWG